MAGVSHVTKRCCWRGSQKVLPPRRTTAWMGRAGSFSWSTVLLLASSSCHIQPFAATTALFTPLSTFSSLFSTFPSTPSLLSACLFNQLRYVCHTTAKHPAKIGRFCGLKYVKLKAVTAGQNFQLFTNDTGTVSTTLLFVSSHVPPLSKLCIPKKYVLNNGAKAIWFTQILTARLSAWLL